MDSDFVLIQTPITATYTLIYSFLKTQAHTKAADAVKKAAKDVVELKDDMEVDGASLKEVVKSWKATQSPKKAKPSKYVVIPVDRSLQLTPFQETTARTTLNPDVWILLLSTSGNG